MRLRQHVRRVDLDYGLALLDTRSGRYFLLDGAGGVVVAEMLDGRDVDETAATLVGRFRVDFATARADTARLLDRVRDAGLVEMPPGAAS